MPTNAWPYMIRAWCSSLPSGASRPPFQTIAVHLELNPNLAANLFAMAWTEAIRGEGAAAREHAELGLRLSPRETDIWLGEGYSALALASFYERDFAEALRWGHLADQQQPVIQALMVAANGHLGDLAAARAHAESLEGFAPGFLTELLSEATPVCAQPAHNALLLEGLRLAGVTQGAA